ncbi:hypothetical protein ACQUJS_03990 [Ralstonia pseudosolanacearum]|uniref:Uncharacterized protein n=1 Tax=Ralstonia solanacearum TaxID=305 RepID=A0A0S4TXW1_RALSL|nr:hypothetical protein RSP799_23265 [Ralstonia solanacearum]CUV14874.1 protein of unknown function [Ralstonia solanacearum]
MIKNITGKATPMGGADRLDEYRRFGGCVSDVPLPNFAETLNSGSRQTIVVRGGWAITGAGCLPAEGARIADVEDADAGAILQVDDRFELPRRFSLHVLRVDATTRGRIESSASSARRVHTAIVSAQATWCAQVLDLLQDYFSVRGAGTGSLAKIATLRHQLGDAQRQLRFFEEWLHVSGNASSQLATEIAIFSASLARLGGGRSFLAGSLCDAAAMYALLVNLYSSVEHE